MSSDRGLEATLRAAYSSALERIAALRSAQEGIRSAEPGAVNPLDLSQLDPLTPGAFPGIGTPATGPSRPSPSRPEPSSSRPEPSSSRPEPVEGQATGPSTSSGHVEQAAAAAPTTPEPAEPEPEPKTLEELLAELDALTGLTEVKAEIHRQVAVLRVEGLRTKAGLRSPTITRHLVFVGNPGTGKTTVARLVGGIYRALGLLSKGQLIEVDRSELVAGYLGQTAMKTADVVTSAAGGVLFIDEAYSLSGDQYGQESVDTLVKEMEDRRDDLVLIVAGYPDPMAIFIAQNPGLASRFRTTIEFADYTDEELVEIFLGMAAAADYDVGEDCLARFKMILAITPRGPIFGNGRFARNLLEAAVGRHAWRLRDIAEPTVAQLRMLMAADLDDHGDQSRPDPEDQEQREWPPEPVDGQDQAEDPDQGPSTSSGHVAGEDQDQGPSTSSGHVEGVDQDQGPSTSSGHVENEGQDQDATRPAAEEHLR